MVKNNLNVLFCSKYFHEWFMKEKSLSSVAFVLFKSFHTKKVYLKIYTLYQFMNRRYNRFLTKKVVDILRARIRNKFSIIAL